MWRSFLNMSGGAVLLSIPVWVAGALYSKMRRRTALGFGDVKLLVLLGVFLGPDKGIMALLLGSVGGSAVGLAHILVTRKDPRSYELPFGSYLCAAGMLLPLIDTSGMLLSPASSP